MDHLDEFLLSLGDALGASLYPDHVTVLRVRWDPDRYTSIILNPGH